MGARRKRERSGKCEFVLASNGERLQVIRPKEPSLAIMIAKIALDKQDGALFERLPAEVGDYTWRGYLGRRRKDRVFCVIDENGQFVGGLEPGDSFVTGIGLVSTLT